jgi:bacteriorhodopsin
MITGIIRNTIDISLLIQWVALIFGIAAAGSMGPGGLVGPLGVVLTMENVVQVVEIIFYHWYRWLAAGSAAVASGARDIAWIRYIDWMFTTPVMLVSTALFFEWQRRESGKKNGTDDSAFSLWNWLGENQSAIWAMVLSNGIMLGVGFLQEMGILDIVTSSVLGFAALGISFWVLGRLRPSSVGGDGVDGSGVKSKLLGNGEGGLAGWMYPFMYVVWALYGVAAMLPSLWKNVMYNVLDLFSKNFYGMYVSWIILSGAAEA